MNQTLPHHSAPVSELDRQIGNLTAGAHLCPFYEDDPSEQLPMLVPFIQQAFDANEGTGIGPAKVRKSIQRMGGQVRVVSDGAHGSQFWIQLPDAKTS